MHPLVKLFIGVKIMPTEQMFTLKDVIIPIFTLIIALLSVCIALATLMFSRKDRQESREYLKEQEQAAKDAHKRRQQEEIFLALQGGKESVGFMALQLARKPDLVSKENQDSILSALCLAYLFDKSRRARSLIFKALKIFSNELNASEQIIKILSEIWEDFKEHDKKTKKDYLTKYHEERIQVLMDEFKN